MNGYTLTYTIGGETVTDTFASLRWAEAAFSGLERNEHCSRAELSGAGYGIRQFVRNGCPGCDARGHVNSGRWSKGEVVWHATECVMCGGTGRIYTTGDTLYEPAEASQVRCPDCTPDAVAS